MYNRALTFFTSEMRCSHLEQMYKLKRRPRFGVIVDTTWIRLATVKNQPHASPFRPGQASQSSYLLDVLICIDVKAYAAIYRATPVQTVHPLQYFAIESGYILCAVAHVAFKTGQQRYDTTQRPLRGPEAAHIQGNSACYRSYLKMSDSDNRSLTKCVTVAVRQRFVPYASTENLIRVT